jgi:hypothetical protein
MQCPVIGTCLNLKELRKIARKSGFALAEGWTEFQVHGAFVSACREENPVSKAVNKSLERKFALAVRRFAKVENEDELREFWEKARAEGNIPGPFWAVLTHPVCTEALRTDVFGEVHMLSHLVGAANRADVRRLAEMEKLVDEQAAGFAKAKAAYRSRLRSLQEENREYKRNLFSLSKEAERWRNRAKESGNEALRAENEAFKSSLGSLSLMLFEANAKAEDLERRAKAAAERLGYLEEQLEEKNAETRFLERELQRLSAADVSEAKMKECDKAGTDECPGPDLCGKRILYVGGRTNMVRHYKNLVERCGGEFLHHDGGVEETAHVLARLLPGVDAVICPLDKVSHDACNRVRLACKHGYKPLKLLKSSGLSSLAGGLRELAATYSNNEVN